MEHDCHRTFCLHLGLFFFIITTTLSQLSEKKRNSAPLPWKHGPWPPRTHRSRVPAAAAHSDTLERCCRSLGSPSGGSGPWCAYAHHQKVLLGMNRDKQKQTKRTNEEERKWIDPNAGYWKTGLTSYMEILSQIPTPPNTLFFSTEFFPMIRKSTQLKLNV